MYLLHPVDYPDRTLARNAVENAWTGSGLPQPVPPLPGTEVGPAHVRSLIEATLGKAGATPVTNGALEVPRSSAGVLERLEEFYHRLYPETRNAPGRGHFQYEEVEWLGEF